ncbi:MAG: bifunctional folylpolyglutamate synthase/dihydrofolate synthase [Salinispira sp.]
MTADFAYFEQFTNVEKSTRASVKFRLDRMVTLLGDFADPQNNMALVHVAGSKGKGMTSAFTAALLADALGEPVGIYASPHIEDYRERIRLSLPAMTDYRDGFFPAAVYEEGITRIQRYLKNRSMQPTTFELLTLLAFILFRAQKIHWAVIEVGLGGRLDSTNVIEPQLCIITPLEIEHSQYLGNTIEEIAGEKAGIIKQGIPVLSQKQDAAAERVIRKKAQELKAPCYFFTDFAHTEKYPPFNTVLTPPYAHENACLAYLAYHLLQKHSLQKHSQRNMPVLNLNPEQALQSIGRTVLPGRFEQHNLSIRTNRKGEQAVQKPIIMDAAHTPASIRAFLTGLKIIRNQHPEKTLTIIFSALEDKDCRTMLEYIMEVCNILIITGCGSFKRADITELTEIARQIAENKPRIKLRVIHEADKALHTVLESSENDIVAICGSFYLIGEMHRALKKYKGVP